MPVLTDSDARVDAIRAHPKFGRGTCSTVDECFSDADLIELFDLWEATTIRKAIRTVRDYEALQKEQELNYGW